MHLRISAAALVVACVVALAQTSKPTFEVVSIRPGSMKPVVLPNGMSVIGATQGGPGTADPELVRMNSVTLKSILQNAYKLKPYQISGPGWIETTPYDITAKVPAGATKDQLNLMLQDLLETRFNLKLHRETKEVRAYNLVQAKGGVKLKDSISTDACSSGARPVNGTCPPGAVPVSGIAKTEEKGGTIFTSPKEGGFITTGRGAAMAGLASVLERQVGGAVVADKTGLEGVYNFRFEFAPVDVGATQGDFAFASLFTALEKELGLKLESTTIPLETLIIDQISQPTEN